MISKLTFGLKKSTTHYVLRPSCYAIIFHSSSSKIAVIQKGDRYFLPGDGMEGNETKEECLHRELLKELGWAKLISISVMKCGIFMLKRKIHII